jgi:GNAT superfamily N-acetyltransferase
MALRIVSLTASEIEGVLPALAKLRVAVFQDWPYLYQGSLAYEEDYLARYARSPGAVVVAAFEGKELVGAATGQPLAGEVDDFRAPFAAAGLDPADYFYFAESVLDPAYRGQGVGHAFFDRREAHARELGFDRAAFCAVIRDDADPRKPLDYRPLDPFWRKRGYRPVPGLTVGFDWPDIGETDMSRKRLQVWTRDGLGGGLTPTAPA